MYNPLSQDLMFQDVHDRAARVRDTRGKDTSARPRRRWWRKAAVSRKSVILVVSRDEPSAATATGP